MKKKEKIDWGVLAFVFIFCCCLRLGMHLNLTHQPYPNDLNAYQAKSILEPIQSSCGNIFEPPFYNDSIDLNLNPIIFNGAIR